MSKPTSAPHPAGGNIVNTLLWALTRLTPKAVPKVPTPDADALPLAAGKDSAGPNVLYLAYGSNLNSVTFEGRRGIKPVSATVVSVPSLRLTFDLPGIPYLEPRFANVQLMSEKPEAMEGTALLSQGYRDGQEDDNPVPSLVGVVYEVTPTDFATIIATEGGGSSYQDVVVDCFPISSSPSPSSAEPLKAHTLLAPQSKTRNHPAQSSARYLGLISTGAVEHGLPLSYRNYLARYRPYQATSARQRIGRAVFGGFWLPVVFSVFGLARIVQGPGGRAPAWAARLNRMLFSTMWWSYDWGFKQVFGNGEHTVGDEVEEAEEEERLRVQDKVEVEVEKGPRVGEMFVGEEQQVASLSTSWETL